MPTVSPCEAGLHISIGTIQKMVWTLLQGFHQLTAAEEQLLRISAAANKLTEANWKAFNSWVQAKDPNVP